jgi:serine/threonine protein kinase/tetratricopeptide (TPR) repeat protein
MYDRQPDIKIGLYRLIKVTPPLNSASLIFPGLARAHLEMVLESDDSETHLENFDKSAFITELANFLRIQPAEITILKVEKGSVRLLLELPATAAHDLYLMAGDTVQGLPNVPQIENSNRVGQRIRDYELREQIGVGGSGAVYRAYQPNVLRDVAIKIILPSYANQPEFIRRFEHEAKVVARLEHMNIVPLYDFWRDENGAYLAMRWLRGGSLRTRLKQSPLEVSTIVRILNQICAALDFAHQRGVIHRDIKPDNILLDESGNAYLSDFGIAKDLDSNLSVTGHGMMDGTPHYMSPEPFRGEPVTPLSDVYGLGIVLYELLTGERPFGNVPMEEIVYKKLHDSPPSVKLRRSELPESVNVVIQKATAKDPTSRYSNVLHLAHAFEQALQLADVARDGAYSIVITPAGSTPVFGKLKSKLYERADLILEKPRRLIGRDDVVSHVKGLLAENERVLLQGMGGIGKTSLAATVAAEWIESAKGSVIWLEAVNENADTLFEALARALGEQATIVDKTGDERLEMIRRLLTEKKLLLVIDNIWNERALYEMMKALPPHLPVLLTSRSPLPIDGEIINVEDLTPDNALVLLNYHARQDFSEDNNAQDLCRLLGYHPFTLEIAGKRLKVNRSMTPMQLIESIKDAPHELDMPDNFSDAGRKGVKDLLDASVDELANPLRNTFVFMGGLFSPVASVELLSLVADQVPLQSENALNDLQQRGLVEFAPTTDDAPAHYRLHDLTYSYARALYKEQFKNRDSVIMAVQSFVDDHASVFDTLEFEQPNILGAVKAAQMTDHVQTVLDIMHVLAVRGYMDARGHTLLLLEQLDNAIDTARQMQPQPAETLHFLLSKRGNAYVNQGNLAQAFTIYTEALELAPNSTRKAILMSVIGTVRFRQGQDDAASYLEQAYQIAKSNQDDLALSIVLEHQGHQAKSQNNHETALRYFKEALVVAERLSNIDRQFFALLNVGALEYELNQVNEALVSHKMAYQLAQQNDNLLWIANALQCMAEDYDQLGDRKLAQENFSAALASFRAFGATARVDEMIQFMTDKHYVVAPK